MTSYVDIIQISSLFVKAIMMLFFMRFLIQLSNAYYFSPLVKAVVSLTNPLCNIKIFSNIKIKSVFIGPLVIAYLIDLLYFFIVMPLFTGTLSTYIIYYSILQTIKTFGLLIILLLFAQALTSWLPQTRELSATLGQITYPLVAPIQKIIPPIGMIDISLMIVLLGIFAINRLLGSFFGAIWYFL